MRLLPFSALLVAALLPAQTRKAAVAPPAQGSLLDITLERQVKDKVEVVAANHVFEPGDTVRLSLKSNFQGYLYVMDQGSSGKFSTIFPAADTGSDNRITPGGHYLVPAGGDGWFEIEGPSGFEVLYFILSPTPMAPAIPATRPKAATPSPVMTMHPRCNDAIFRARGECMDDSAGPAAVAPGTALPEAVAPLGGAASRDIIFTRKTGTTSVSTAAGLSAPVIYTFRLAHH